MKAHIADCTVVSSIKLDELIAAQVPDLDSAVVTCTNELGTVIRGTYKPVAGHCRRN